MAGSVNKVILIGNLGRDPDVRQTHAGEDIVHLSIATSESWRDKNSGERKERTEWHRVVIFNENIGKIAKQYLKKGAKVYLEGQIQTRKWTNQEGQEQYTTEVVIPRFRGELTMLEGGGGDRPPPVQGPDDYGQDNGGRGGLAGSGGRSGGFGGANASGRSGPPPSRGDLDDEIPF